MKKLIIYLFITIVILSNIPILNYSLLAYLDEGKIRYSNHNGSRTIIEDFNYKSGITDQEESDKLYRLYSLNPLCFWRWSFYLLVSKDFEYKDWDKIEPNRVPYDPNNIMQEF